MARPRQTLSTSRSACQSGKNCTSSAWSNTPSTRCDEPWKSLRAFYCNNFNVSCERVFRPDLEGVPVIVLSNNDGCAVARSSDYVESIRLSNLCQLFERMFAARAVDADKCVSPHLFRSTHPVLVIGEARRLDDACPLRPHQRTRRGSVSAFLPLVRKVRICSTKTVSSSCNVSVGVPPVNSAKSWTICIWS